MLIDSLADARSARHTAAERPNAADLPAVVESARDDRSERRVRFSCQAGVLSSDMLFEVCPFRVRVPRRRSLTAGYLADERANELGGVFDFLVTSCLSFRARCSPGDPPYSR
jgi:hypothetical protein